MCCRLGCGKPSTGDAEATLAVGLAGFAAESHACSRAGAAGQTAPSVHRPVQAASEGSASLSPPSAGSVLGTARLGSPEPSSYNSRHQLEPEWENACPSQRVNVPLSSGDWKPRPGHPCRLEVMGLLCTLSHLQRCPSHPQI